MDHLVRVLEQNIQELATAIHDAAVLAGICKKDVPLTGPQLISLCEDMGGALKDAQEAAGVWQPIGDAPKKERLILWAKGWGIPATGRWAVSGFSPDGNWVNEWNSQPTHFMYLPEPPKEK